MLKVRGYEAYFVLVPKHIFVIVNLENQGNKKALYVNDKKNGVEKGYYEDGSIRWETHYKNDKKNGVEKWYHEDGSLVSTTKYKNDVLDGYKHCSDGRMGNESLYCW